jgi:phosphoenolpyruvate synthase/pyruvate phosphate dikinase
MIYEVITGQQFDFTPTSGLEAINAAVQSYFASLNTE